MNTKEVTDKYRLNKWTDIIRECRTSGQSVNAWCADHDINVKSYYYWLKKVRKAASEALPSVDSKNASIVPVNLPGQTESDKKTSLSDITLRIGSITLELHNNASATLIENTLKAIQNVR